MSFKGIILRAVFFGGIAFILLMALVPSVAWDGATYRQIEFTVANEQGGKIEGAYVWLQEDPGSLRTKTFVDSLPDTEREKARQWYIDDQMIGVTDTEGATKVMGQFGAGGSQFLFITTGRYIVDQTVFVSAEGYGTQEFDLPELLGKEKFKLSKKHLEAEIVMKRQPTDSNNEN